MRAVSAWPTVGRWTLALVLASAVLGCPKKKTDGGDAAADAEVLAVVDSGPATPEAANVTEIARFGDETRLDPTTAKLEAPVTIVRKSPPNGDHVIKLLKGTEVTKIAQHKDSQFLVTFANPKNAAERLMGWIAASGFTAPPPSHGPGACKTDKDCKAPASCVHATEGFRCEIKCDDSTVGKCDKGFECTGNGLADGGIVRFCVAAKDAGAPAEAGASDAGARTDGGR